MHIVVANCRGDRYNGRQEEPPLQGAKLPDIAAFAMEDPMFTMMTLVNILLVNIILVLVLVILVREENSVFGHAENKAASAA